MLVDVAANDTDPNPGDTLSVVPGSISAPVDGEGTTRGTAVLESDEIRYTPATGYAGTVTFTYTVSDGNGGTSTGTVTVVVENAPPVADDDTASTATDTPATVDVFDGDTDPNIPGTPQVLVVTGAIAVTYTVADGAGGTDVGVLTLTVDNAAPVAMPDTAITPYLTSVGVDILATTRTPTPATP